MSPLARALEALDRRLQAVEARLLREPRWLGSGVCLHQRLSVCTRGRSARFVERLEARDLRALQTHLSHFAPSCPVEPPLSPAPGQGGAL